MKAILMFLLLCIHFVITLHSQSVEIKDSSNETLVTINDEGPGKSSISIQNSNSVPGIITDKLYNYEHNLYWNGNELGVAGSAGGWTEGGTNVYLSTNSDSVGIGTTSPLFKLDVTNIVPGGSVEAAVNTDSSGGALAAYSSTFPFPFDHFADRVSLWSNGFTASGLDLRADGATSDMRFYTGGLLPANERLRITPEGMIGVGKISPAYKLDVAGEIGADQLHIDGTGVAMTVGGKEAIWFNELEFSWGFGGIKNYFADHVHIGGTQSGLQLYVEDYSFGSIAKFVNTYTTGSGSGDGIIIQAGADSNPSSGTKFIEFRDGDGSIIASIAGNGTGGVQYNTTSDARLKTNISDYTEGLDLVSRMQVRNYEMTSAPGIQQIGFLAQELQEVYPQAVSGFPESDVIEEPMMIDYGRITPILVQAIQELQVENKQLKDKLEVLEKTLLKDLSTIGNEKIQ